MEKDEVDTILAMERFELLSSTSIIMVSEQMPKCAAMHLKEG